VPVTIDGSVYEVAHAWQRQKPELGRELELAIRVATICASFDGKTVLTGKDMESGAVRANMEYQTWVRTKLQPNAGENPNAVCSNAVVAWLESHAPRGQWVNMRDLKRGLNYNRQRLGPNVFGYAIQSLASPIARVIELREVKPSTAAGGRPAIHVRLLVD
jgi:hypothetical protein